MLTIKAKVRCIYYYQGEVYFDPVIEIHAALSLPEDGAVAPIARTHVLQEAYRISRARLEEFYWRENNRTGQTVSITEFIEFPTVIFEEYDYVYCCGPRLLYHPLPPLNL